LTAVHPFQFLPFQKIGLDECVQIESNPKDGKWQKEGKKAEKTVIHSLQSFV